MAEKLGKLKICDRCGEQIFLELTKTDTLDGGYTKVLNYECPPEGWQWHSETGQLCPHCNAEFLELVRKFKGDKDERVSQD